MMRYLIAALVCASLLMATAARADDNILTPEKRADIMSLVRASGALKAVGALAETMGNELRNQLQRNNPKITKEAADAAVEEFHALLGEMLDDKGGFIDEVAVIYNRHFSHAEVREMRAFFESPLGQKLASLQGDMARESSLAGQRWMAGRLPEFQERLRKRLKAFGIEE